MSDSVEIAKAFVQIVPSMEGAQSAITKGLTGASDDAGTKSGKRFGSKFTGAAGGALKGMMKAVAAGVAVKEVTDFGKAALDSYANFEQLQGGVGKIFDKMDNSVIFEDAANAYKTLNMSANDYLEIINDVGASFSATMGDQKGYEAAKTGLQAIADYSSGTGKNLDVLKDKFGMITRSTSSYQSIADQFSGILPATSKDFLAQAQAAGVLEKSYTELTQVPIDEYQQAVSSMLQKGVEDLGLTNNTFNETEQTISGSLAGMQAAWSNWLVALGSGDNLDEVTTQLFDSLIIAAENVLPAIGDIFGNLGTVISGKLPEIATMIENELLNIAPSGMMEGITGAFDGFENLTEKITTFASEAGEALTNFADENGPYLSATFSDIMSFATEAFDAIASAVKTAMPVIGATVQIAMTVVRGAFNGLRGIIGIVRGVFNAVKEAITNPVETAKGIISGIVDKIKGFFNFTVPTPHIPLPHFVITPEGWGVGDLLKGKIPSLSVSWYAKGGIVNSAAVLGESGAEAIVPYTNDNIKPWAHALADAIGARGGTTINLYYNKDADANQMVLDIAAGLKRMNLMGA